MKHYTDKTHIKIIIISAVIIIFTFVCIIGYIDVNKRFPKAGGEFYSEEQWIDYDYMQIKAKKMEYLTKEEYGERYENSGIADRSDKLSYFVLTLELHNLTDEDINLNKNFIGNVSLEAYPQGYNNQGNFIDGNGKADIRSILEANQTKEFTIVFNVNESVVGKSRINKLKKSDIYFSMSCYPVHKAIVFNGVD